MNRNATADPTLQHSELQPAVMGRCVGPMRLASERLRPVRWIEQIELPEAPFEMSWSTGDCVGHRALSEQYPRRIKSSIGSRKKTNEKVDEAVVTSPDTLLLA